MVDKASVGETWVSQKGPDNEITNMGYPTKSYLKLKFREISFLYESPLSCRAVLKYCTEHDSAVLGANTENDSKISRDVVDVRFFARFEFNP